MRLQSKAKSYVNSGLGVLGTLASCVLLFQLFLLIIFPAVEQVLG